MVLVRFVTRSVALCWLFYCVLCLPIHTFRYRPHRQAQYEEPQSWGLVNTLLDCASLVEWKVPLVDDIDKTTYTTEGRAAWGNALHETMSWRAHPSMLSRIHQPHYNLSCFLLRFHTVSSRQSVWHKSHRTYLTHVTDRECAAAANRSSSKESTFTARFDCTPPHIPLKLTWHMVPRPSLQEQPLNTTTPLEVSILHPILR